MRDSGGEVTPDIASLIRATLAVTVIQKFAKDMFRDIFYPALYEHTVWVNGETLQPAVEAAYKEAEEMALLPCYFRFPVPPLRS
jgi:hypothetical protein